MSDNPFEKAKEEEGERGEFIGVGAGQLVRISSAQDATTSTKGDPQIELQLSTEDGRTMRQWVWYDASRGSKGLWKLIQFLEAAGMALPGEGEYDPQDKGRLATGYLDALWGRWVEVDVIKDDGQKYPSVDEWRQPTDPSLIPDLPFDGPGPAMSDEAKAALDQDPDLPF